MRDSVTKIAPCHDELGNVFLNCDACNHLGCHGHWNSLERCWDFPSHGSQFAVGTALNGPAISPLADVGALRKRGR